MKPPAVLAAELAEAAARQEADERTCLSKRRYVDEFVARYVGNERQRQTGTPLFVYKCRLCRGWHLTRTSQWKTTEAAVDFYLKPERT